MSEPDEMGYPPDPADSRPCSCPEAEELKSRLDWACREVVSLEKRLAEATSLLRQWWQAKAGDEQGMPFFETGAFLGHPPPVPTLLERIEVMVNAGQCPCCEHIRGLFRSHQAGGS